MPRAERPSGFSPEEIEAFTIQMMDDMPYTSTFGQMG
jgi:hypothetical protein